MEEMDVFKINDDDWHTMSCEIIRCQSGRALVYHDTPFGKEMDRIIRHRYHIDKLRI